MITERPVARVKIAHVIKVTGLAGAENHLLSLLPGLRARGYEARLLLLVEPDRPCDEVVAAAEARGIPTARMVIHGDADLSLIGRLWGWLRQERPDVVHTHLLHADLYAIPAARLAGVPVVITSRHNDNAFRRRFPLRQINGLLWRWVDAGIAISHAIKRFSVEVEGAPSARVETIHYGLTAGESLDKVACQAALRAELGLPEDSLLVGTACRLTEQKGLVYGLDAFARIAPQFPTVHLAMTGDGPLRAELEARAAQPDLAGRVHFLGWRTEMAPIYAALDVFLMPSLWEGFGLVLLEAMAQGVPVVGSAVSAIPEVVIDGETGLLVPPRDPVALAEALAVLLADPARRAAMGAAGRARLEAEFSPARMVGATAALYDRLAAIKGRG